MSKTVRFRFGKKGQTQFVSHLDLMRCMKRSFRRAGIPLEHTEGFNPHPKLSFDLPLPVGVVSDVCFMDAVIEEPFSCDELVQRLNKALPEGLIVYEAVVTEDKKSLMSQVTNASYRYVMRPLDCDADVFTNEMKSILDQEGIYIEKETKKSLKMINIKDMLQWYRVSREGETTVLDVMCSAGSVNNLNPILLWRAVCMYTDYRFDLLSLERTGLYKNENGKTVPIR